MTIPAVFDSIILDGIAKSWTNEDYITIFRPLQELGYFWNPDTLRLEVPQPYSMQSNTPWVHVKQTPDKHCTMDHQILFNKFGIIPPRCLECWKVVVTPKSFAELMALEQLETQLNTPSKCGIELREYTPKHYGGYFYNNSLDEGRECHLRVKEAVADVISPELAETIILKRGCTEYEMVQGPSPYWNITKEAEQFMHRVEAMVYVERRNTTQPEVTKTNVRLRWMVYAHQNADFSYKPWNNDKELFPGYVKYHEGDIDDIKHDLALARGHARGGINPEISDEFLVLCHDFAKENKISLNGLTHTLGANVSNPLDLMKINLHKDTPEELKGDQDERT